MTMMELSDSPLSLVDDGSDGLAFLAGLDPSEAGGTDTMSKLLGKGGRSSRAGSGADGAGAGGAPGAESARARPLTTLSKGTGRPLTALATCEAPEAADTVAPLRQKQGNANGGVISRCGVCKAKSQFCMCNRTTVMNPVGISGGGGRGAKKAGINRTSVAFLQQDASSTELRTPGIPSELCTYRNGACTPLFLSFRSLFISRLYIVRCKGGVGSPF